MFREGSIENYCPTALQPSPDKVKNFISKTQEQSYLFH